ncbi:hypothetical protein [Lysinibacillus sp. NPDC047702]|uniref:hypothetical protein n=1 Tax=unclassified Lysinibacillus TaxID=2636778 RepID=UPI003D0285B2
MTNTRAIEVLEDVTSKTLNGVYKGSFKVDSKRNVRMNIKNKGNVSIILQVEDAVKGTMIATETVKPNSEKEITKPLDGGTYDYSIDGQGDVVPFQFRVVGLDNIPTPPTSSESSS